MDTLAPSPLSPLSPTSSLRPPSSATSTARSIDTHRTASPASLARIIPSPSPQPSAECASTDFAYSPAPSPAFDDSSVLPRMYPPPTLLRLLSQATQKLVGRTGEPRPDFLLTTTITTSQTVVHFRPARKEDIEQLIEVRCAASKVDPTDKYLFPKQAEYPQDIRKFYRADLENSFHSSDCVLLVAEIGGRTPGTAASGGGATGLKRVVVGQLELWWGGKTRRADDKDAGRPRIPITKAQLKPIFRHLVARPKSELAWSLNRSRDRARCNSLSKVLKEAEKSYDKTLFDEDVEDHWHISQLVVHPDFERQGIGSRLLSLVLEAVEVRQETVALTAVPGKEAFYAKRGMSTLGVAEHESGRWVEMYRQPERKERNSG